MNDIAKLIDGYRHFYRKYFIEDNRLAHQLAAEGQSARIAMIACSDSRVDPSIITDADLGELFVIRNVANLIPPYQPNDETYHGTSAALEFAVSTLGVQHLIVCGHSQCAGIRALIDDKTSPASPSQSFIRSWMNMVVGARDEIRKAHGDLPLAQQAHLCERRVVEYSLQNLLTFPWILDKVIAGTLSLHGWHFNIENGTLSHFENAATGWESFTK